MTSPSGKEFEKFDIFELAKNPECRYLILMVLKNLETYDFGINSQDEDGNTLLHLIVNYQDRYDVLERLLCLNPDINKCNNISETPLHLACYKQNVKLMRLLLSKGADLSVRDTKLRSLLHIAVERKNLDLCKFLIDRKIDINSQDHNGSTPLHYAVESKLTQITFLLVVHKADVNRQDVDDYTPLHIAASKSAKLVKFLLRNKASPSMKTFNGDLPLHLAASTGSFEAVVLLLNAGSSPTALNRDNYSAAKLAELNGHEKVQQLLLGKCDISGKSTKIPVRQVRESAIGARAGNIRKYRSRSSVTVKRMSLHT